MKTALQILRLVTCAMLAACNADHKPAQSSTPPSAKSSSADLTGAQWTLEELAGESVIANSHASIAFPEAGRVAGNGSCNRFTGTAQIDGSSLKFGPMAATRMMCDPDSSQQETAYLKALESVQRFEVRDGKLYLYGSDAQKPLRFARAEAHAGN